MVAAYTWHPGAGRVAGRWPVPVPLLPDELFSAWLVRAALAQGADPLALTGSLWPRWRAWTIDLDRGIDDNRLEQLAWQSGHDVKALQAALLLPVARSIGPEPLSQLGVWPWMLALGSRNRKRRGGLQYCPFCLSGDTRPYFRLQWRLAWHTSCAEHRIALSDQCDHCHAPIEPNLLEAGSPITLCPTCRSDLRRAKTKSASTPALKFQQTADAVARTGAGQYGAYRVVAKDWFAVGRYLVMLLRCAARSESSALRACLTSLDASVATLRPPLTGLSIEMLPASERAQISAIVGRLLDEGPEKLQAAALGKAVSYAALLQDWPILPSVLLPFIGEAPQPKRPRTQRRKKNTYFPTPRRSVLLRWARFRRKVRPVQ